jgi:uncharacterized LabA/DUF88 family protein
LSGPRETAPTLGAGAVGPGLLTLAGSVRTVSASLTSTSSTVEKKLPNIQRVVAYIDGFNLYHGLRDAKLMSSRWLDLHEMCNRALVVDQRLDLVRYFTTRVRNSQTKVDRQSTYIDALLARGTIAIDFGHFLMKKRTCRTCNTDWSQAEEKKTDVNIAVRLLEDAYDDRFDTALLVSGDSDLVPPLEAVRRRFPEKRLVVAFPPKRQSHDLKAAADRHIVISPSLVRKSRLPETVVDPVTGVEYQAPPGWLVP